MPRKYVSDDEKKFSAAVFSGVCQFVRTQRGLPDQGVLFNKSKQLAENIYWQKFRFLDDAAIVEKVHQQVAAYIWKNYDPKRAKKTPKTTRVLRLDRDAQIKFRRDLLGESYAQIAEKLNFTKTTVERALQNQHAAPKRIQALEKLSDEARLLVTIIDKASPRDGVGVFDRTQFFYELGRQLNLDDLVVEINSASIGLRIFYNGTYFAFSRGRNRTDEQLQTTIERITNPNKNTYCHLEYSVFRPLRSDIFKSGLGEIIFLVFWCHKDNISIFEDLWLASFQFLDPYRVQLAVRRALRTENGFDSIRKYSRRDEDMLRKQLNRAVRLTADCRSLIRPVSAIEHWINETGLRASFSTAERGALDEMLANRDHLDKCGFFETAVEEILIRHLSRENEAQPIPETTTDLDAGDDLGEQVVPLPDYRATRHALDLEIQDELGPLGFEYD